MMTMEQLQQGDKTAPTAQHEPFVLALDCGAISAEEMVSYEHARAYVQARAVWEEIQSQVMGKGVFISARTMATYGRFYCIAYGEQVPQAAQMQAFRILDRARQQYAASGATFVRLPQETIAALFQMRVQAATSQLPVGVTEGGVLYRSREPRVQALEAERPMAIEPPFASIPLDLWVLCLDYGEARVLSETRYTETSQAVRASVSGMGSQRVLIGGRFYLAVLTTDAPTWAKRRFTRWMLDLHQRDGAPFVKLPDGLLAHMLPRQAELMARVNQQETFAESSMASILDEEVWGEVPIEHVAPPALDEPVADSRKSAQRGAPVTRKTRSLLAGYYTARRLRFERGYAELAKLGAGSAEMRTAAAVERSILLAVGRARYYLFEDSALALVARLMMEPQGRSGTHIREMPQMHLFARFASPIQPEDYEPVWGLFFADPASAFRALVAQDTSARALFTDQLYRPGEALPWTLSLLGANGDTIVNLLYDTESSAWCLPEAHVCPAGACTLTPTPAQVTGVPGAAAVWSVCPGCAALRDYFARWVPIALLAVAGEFATTEEPVLREQSEEVVYKEKRPGSGKYDEKRVRVGWQVLTFDAVAVRRRAPDDAAGPDAAEKPSWLDLAIERGAVLYVRRSFGKSTRRLDPTRNARWKYAREVPVRGYSKRVPMSVERLSHTITRVVASGEEEGGTL